MALLNTTKLVYGALGIGAIGGSSAGLYYYLNDSDSKQPQTSITPKNQNTDIATKLSKEKYQLLESSSGEWTQILAAYKENPELHFKGFDGKTPQTGAEKELQKLCDKATKLDSTKDTDKTYDKAKKWCTKPRALTVLLADKGYTMLDTTESGDPDSTSWDTKLNEHKSATTHSDKKFTDLDLNESGASNSANRTKLRAKCKGLKDKKHYEKEFDKELEQAILWCSKSSK